MQKFIFSITASAVVLVALLVGESSAQTTTINGGKSSRLTAEVKAGALAGTEAGLVVRCASGCSGGSGGAAQADNSALGDLTGMGALYDTTPPAITDGNVGMPVMDSSRRLIINCGTGCSGGTQYAEDTAHVSGDSVTLAGVLQQSADAAVSSDGDRSVLQVDANGYLKVNIKAGAGSGGTAMTDDAAFTPATTSGTPAFFMFDDVSPDSVNEGDGGIGRMSANRNQYVTIRDAAGNERGLNVDASGNITVNVTGTVTVGSHAVTNAGTFATQPAGSVAHDAVGTGVNPVLTGGYASAAAPTDVSADGDAVRGWFLRSGAQAVQPTFGGVLAVAGNGASGTGVQRVTIANDSTGTIIATQATGTNLHVVCDSGCGSGTQYAEDAAETAGASLSMAGSVRRDTAASSAGTTGDNATINTDATGRLWTRPTGAVTPANSFAIPSDAITVWSINGCYNGTTIDLCTKATAGAGAVDSGTQRITWASDAPGIKAEDSAHTTADPGMVILTKRTDTAATSAGTDGDYATLNTDANGNLWIRCSSGCGAGTQYAEDIAHTTGDQLTMAGAVRRDTAASSSGTDGDISTINVDATGRLWANTELPDAAALADATANPTTTGVASYNMCYNGTTWDRCVKGDSGNGTVGSNTQRVTIASDSTGTVITTQATAANLNVRTDNSGATGAAPPARAAFIGGIGSGATGGFVIGPPVADTFKSVSVTSGTTTLLVTGVSGRHVRISAINLVTAIANNVALISGTGATCGTGTAGISGGTTAANGWNLAANGGLAYGSGVGTIMQTAATGDSVCVITSSAGPLAGTLSYAIY